MRAVAKAPGKIILFGEHAVVFGKPALAMAVNCQARVEIRRVEEEHIQITVPSLDVTGTIKGDGVLECSGTGKQGILNYTLQSIQLAELEGGLEVHVELEIPIGAGMGSSAAVTVATLAALAKLEGQALDRGLLAQQAHQVEQLVQGAASPLDTAVSAYGGLVHLNRDGEVENLEVPGPLPLVVACTSSRGNTGELVAGVRRKRSHYPGVVDPILEAMEQITIQARKALMDGEKEVVGGLMNINHGLLDALGVNTMELSTMAYQARAAGALGSKITGAGGGGAIIAYAPEHFDAVLSKLREEEEAFPVELSIVGVELE
ncbi:MAG TPA: mevalonate kinase [Methanobacteriaceae archaeon]|nr:mevalonate kinase [Methanobacteriaceae archaeon]